MRMKRRHSAWVIVLTSAWLLFLVWVAWGALSVRGIEQPAYTLLSREEGYEVREYPAYLMAQVSLSGTWSDALERGFETLGDYIAGNNVSQHAIAMTRPVGIEEEPESAVIAVLAPVVTQEKGDAFLVSFMMPASYSAATLPRPNNPAIRIVEVPESVVAVRAFSGTLNAERADLEEKLLRELLARDKRVTVSAARVAQYHPPWTPPFMRHNEVMIPIRRK